MNLMLIILNVTILAGLAVYLSRKEGQLSKLFWPALMLKLAGGIALGLIYWYYYAVGDTITYYHEGVVMADLARSDFNAYLDFLWNPESDQLSALADQVRRALFFSKIVSIFCLMTGDNYWIIALHFSFLSFLGSWVLVSVISRNISSAALPACVAFLFFPSMVFWSAGVIKESMSVAALSFLSGILLRIWFKEKINLSAWILSVLAVWILWNLKYYFAAVFFSVGFTALLFHFLARKYFGTRPFIVQIAAWMVIFIVALGVISFSHPNFHPLAFLDVIVSNYHLYGERTLPAQIHFSLPDATVMSVLRNAPWALVSGLYRPFIWEMDHFLMLPIALENLMLMLLTGFALLDIKSWKNSSHRMLIFSTVVYCALLCIFLTLSTPNFGTLSRYRVAYLPYAALLLLGNARVSMFLQRSATALFGNKGKSTFASH